VKVKALVIDVGGTHVKLLVAGRRTPTKFDSGPHLTPAVMVRETLAATKGWRYEAIAIGYPGPVRNGHPVTEPFNLGRGWRRFDFARAFRVPVRIVNDAAMQALGSYDSGRMLFLGLGTGLGSALIVDGVVEPLELGHLPFKKKKTFEDYVSAGALKKRGKKRWRKAVFEVVDRLAAAMQPDYVVIGGGGVDELDELPPNARRGDNTCAFAGGFRLWDPDWVPSAKAGSATGR
jgi:polyphosphate glucokinase